MSTRVQSSPFRETEFDQRLDRMLDDLKSTVHTDDEGNRTPLGVRSTSRSSSRAGSVPRRGVSVDGGVSDGGRLTHHHKEYTSPDQNVRTIADTYQYDSGSAHPSGNFQKKVVKSTYSSYNVNGGLSNELEALKRGPSDLEMERALSQESRNILNSNTYTNTTTNDTANNSKVIDASQEVARELVGALSCIGSDSESEDRQRNMSQNTGQMTVTQQQQFTTQNISNQSTRFMATNQLSTQYGGKQTVALNQDVNTDDDFICFDDETTTPGRTVVKKSNGNVDYSTLGRLKKNINELGSMIDDMDKEEMDHLNKKYLLHVNSVKQIDDRKTHSEGNLNNMCTDVIIADPSRDGRSLSNGHIDDDVIINDEKGGEVRRIVWRNRYEKTYDTTDSGASNNAPMVSIERDAMNRHYSSSATTGASGNLVNSTTISNLTHPHVPPQISPGGQSWADPVPLPTPPQQVSPREPGVAYIYNYGSSGGSAVQPLPPLNYVAVPPPEGGAPSPTLSGVNQTAQPVIYHYSYHYTIQPGQSLPEGAHPPSSPPPALQIASHPANGYSSQATDGTTNITNRTTNIINEVHRTTSNRENIHNTTTKMINGRPGGDREPLDSNYYPDSNKPAYPNDGKSGTNSHNYTINTTNYRNESHHHPFPTMPSEKAPRDPQTTFDSRDPSSGKPNDPNRNITININKTTTHTSHSTSTRDGSGPDYPPNDNQVPLTSTPYHRRSSRSPERRHPEPRYPSGPSDSLERVRRPPQSGLPFPDTSPVKPQDSTRIPRKVDELMSDFSHKNGGPYGPGYHGHPDSEPLLTGSNNRRTKAEVIIPPPERNEINTISPGRLREEREKTKNQTGPPVYYPPGHEAFSESMHTMTLKEDGRRGKAKWRAEAASGYQESSSHSETTGGVKMVPVCLPLCCGAACTIM